MQKKSIRRYIVKIVKKIINKLLHNSTTSYVNGGNYGQLRV